MLVVKTSFLPMAMKLRLPSLRLIGRVSAVAGSLFASQTEVKFTECGSENAVEEISGADYCASVVKIDSENCPRFRISNFGFRILFREPLGAIQRKCLIESSMYFRR